MVSMGSILDSINNKQFGGSYKCINVSFKKLKEQVSNGGLRGWKGLDLK